MDKDLTSRNAFVWIALSVLVVLAALLRWIGIADHALWLDEIVSLNRASLPLRSLIADSVASLHYPTYFLLLSGVIGLFGDGNLALRLPSLVFGVLCVPLGYAIGQQIAGRTAGLATAALISLAPVQIVYSQEARSYMLMGLFVMVGLWGFVRLAADARAVAAAPAAIWRPLTAAEIAARRNWAAWIAGTAGALIVLNIAVFWLVASLAGLALLRNRLAGSKRAHFDRTLLAGLGMIALVWLPWAVAVSPALIGTATRGFWAPAISFADFSEAIWTFYLSGVSDPVGFEPLADFAPWRAAGIAAAVFAGAWSLRRQGPLLWTLVLAAALPPFALLAASLVTPIFVPRYLFVGTPAVLVLAGCGLALLFQYLRRVPVLAALAAIVILADLSYNLRAYHQAEIKPRWDLAAARLSQSLREGDFVLFQSGFAHWIVTTELQRAGTPLPDGLVLETPDALNRAAFSGRVWVAYGRVGHFPGPDEAEIRNWLAGWGEPARIENLGRQVQLAIFEFASRPGVSGARSPE